MRRVRDTNPGKSDDDCEGVGEDAVVNTAETKRIAGKSSADFKMEGVEAFRAGKPDSECPYQGRGVADQSQWRTWWMHGWIAAGVVSRVRCVTLAEMLR